MKMKRIKGFSLFEIILVMLVLSVAIVAIITHTGRKTQETAADQLGYRLFQYGLAVSDYARQNPEGFNPDNEPETMYGYEWLKNIENPETDKPFLGENFTLNIPPLRIRNVETDDDDENEERVIKTEFSINQTGQGNYELFVDLVELGVVTKPTTTTQRGEAGEMYVVDLSLAGAAANYASTYRNRDGAAVITYRLHEDFAIDPENAHIVGEPKSDVGIGEYWLLISGDNQMQGPVQFNEGVVADNRRISGVDSINFSDKPGTHEMLGVEKIIFSDDPNATQEILGVDTIGFVANNTTVPAFRGFRQTGEFTLSITNNDDWTRSRALSYGNNMLNTSNSICFLTAIQVPQNAATTCEVEPVGTVNTWTLSAERHSSSGTTIVCTARCLMFNWD